MQQKVIFQITAVLLNFLFITYTINSEGSCGTEDWSNDAENTALVTGINYILQYIHIENGYFKL